MLGNVVVTVIVELLSCVWLEVLLFSCAAVAHLAFFGGYEKKQVLEEARLKPVPKAAKLSHGYGHVTSNLATALCKGRLEDAVSMMVQLPAARLGAVLKEAAPRLLAVAASSPDPTAAAALIRDVITNVEPGILEIALEVAVLEAHRRKNTRLCSQLDGFAGLLSISKSQTTLTALANSYSSDIKALRILVHAADVPFTKAFAKAALRGCAAATDPELIVEILERADPMDKDVLAVYVDHVCPTSQCQLHTRTIAALISRIRDCGRKRDLEGAMAAFGSVPVQSGRMGAQLFLSIVFACADCGKWNLAKEYLLRAKQHKVPVDPPGTSALVKSLLATGETSSAVQMLQDAPSLGLQTFANSYHLLLHAYVVAGDRHAAWCLIANMHNAGVEPGAVACSMLLKMINSPAHSGDLQRVMDMVNAMDTAIDNVLLSSLIEACSKATRVDMLADFMDRQHNFTCIKGESMLEVPLELPMYGSLIKAFGQAGEIKRTWRLWEHMQAKGLIPTEVTLGCMIESLVANSQPEAAWKLVQEIWQDTGRRHLVNTVTYATLLKGFSQQSGRVEAVYQEMKDRAIKCNLITYNTLLNIFARRRSMHRMLSVLDDMSSAMPPVEPDLVTFSTLIKGFCAWGHVDRALGLVEEMQVAGKLKPDEMMYNSLLDGCAKEGRLSDAMRLVADMRRDGVAPSNYTLTMLVKLLGRCRRMNQAFSIVDELGAEFGLRPNIQVYTCLIQGCFQNRMPVKALSLLDTMLAKGLCPDEKAYVALVRGHLNMGLLDQAVEIVERAYQGYSPAGVGRNCLAEVIAKLGKTSRAAASLINKVQAVRVQQRTGDQEVRTFKRGEVCWSKGVTGQGLLLQDVLPLAPPRGMPE